MNRLALCGVWVLGGSGCMNLDFMFLSGPKDDVYDLSYDVIDGDLVEQVTFETDDGLELVGTWARQPGAARSPLIYFHGKSTTIETAWDRVEFYWRWGRYDVFVFDYRGYGLSEGEYEPAMTEEDGSAAVRYVAEASGAAPGAIPWVALSLGASVAAHTADEERAQAIVLESMFPSGDQIVDDSTGFDLPTGWFFTAEDELDNVEAVAKSKSPVFVIHGLADDFIEPEYAELVYEAAPDPKQLWQPEGVGHADIIETAPEVYTERVLEWFDRF